MAIIGAGPAGTLLSHLLDRAGIDSVVLERQSREHVLSRIRAGVLEWGSVELLRDAGVGARMDAEGQIHDGAGIAWAGRDYFFIDIKKHTGLQFMAYGQTMIQEDLYLAREAAGGQLHFEASDVRPHDVTTSSPYVTYVLDGTPHRIDCDFVVGCDGYHGVSRTVIPPDVIRTYEKEYPFGWLGDPVRDAAAARPRLLQPPARLRARVAAQPDAQPVLRAVPARRHDRRLARRAVLVRAHGPPPAGHGRAARHRSVDREVDRPAAQLRRRADAIRQPVPRRRRRPHRAADRRQGSQPRDLRRVLPVARLRAALRRPRRPLPRPLLGDGAAAGVGLRCGSRGGSPSCSTASPTRPSSTSAPRRSSSTTSPRRSTPRRRSASSTPACPTRTDALPCAASPSAHCWRNLRMPRWRIGPVPGIFGKNDARQRMTAPPCRRRRPRRRRWPDSP